MARPREQDLGGWKVIETAEQAAALLDRLGKLPGPFGIDTECIVDIERSPVGQGRIVCWSIAWSVPGSILGRHARGMPVCERAFIWVDLLPMFKDWLENDSIPKVGHNVMTFDRHMFANHGIAVHGIVADTLRMSRFLNADSSAQHDLKSLMGRVMGYEEVGSFKGLFSRHAASEVLELPEKHTRRKIQGEFVPTLTGGPYQKVYEGRELIPLDTIPTDYAWLLPTLFDYASLDAKATLELYYFFKVLLEKRPAKRLGGETVGSLWDLYSGFWNLGLLQLTEYERAGVDIDEAACARIVEQIDADLIPVKAAVEAWAPGINWRSSKQYQAFLYTQKRFKVPPYCGSKLEAAKKTPRGKMPGDFVALTYIADQTSTGPEDKAGLRAVLAMKQLEMGRRFAADLPTYRGADHRLHTILAPEADTGRLSARAPALQQIPKRDRYKVRRAFVAPPGHKLIVADYCVAPQTRLLTSDLRWVRADEVCEGDELIGFDEHSTGRQGRRFKRTKVTGVLPVNKPGLVVTMDDGAKLRCSTNHMWLARRSQDKLAWVEASDLRVGDFIGYFGPKWDSDTSREGGYLAGVLDGEGWVAQSGKVGFAQLQNACLERAEAACQGLGLDYRRRSRPADAVQSVEFYGNKAGLRVLGELRPSRLLSKAHLLWEGKRIWSAHLPQRRVVSIETVGVQDYLAIETDAKTYIADGYLSHNCQLEMYVAAHFMKSICKDDTLEQLLASGDMHSAMARQAWPHELRDKSDAEVKASPRRDHAKAVGYGLFYGKSAVGLGVGIRDEHNVPIGTAAAQLILNAYHAAVPALAKLQRFFIEYGKEHWGIHTLLGRFRPVSDIHSEDEWRRGEAERQLLNTPIQGSAHDIVQSAMLVLNTSDLPQLRAAGYWNEALHATGAVGILQVHDELQLRVPSANAERAAELVKYGMENPFPPGVFSVPLRADVHVVDSWGAAK